MGNSSKLHPAVISAIIALIFGMVCGPLVWKALGAGTADVVMTFPTGGSLKINTKNDLANPVVMIKKLLSAEVRAGTLGLLKEQNIFTFDDPSLIDAFLGQCPDKLPNESDEQRRQRWENCLRRNRLFNQLKAYSDSQKPPFQYLGTDVRVGTPGEPARPADGRANVCRNGEFRGRTILLVDPSSPKGLPRQIVVKATGSYLCADTDYFPDIQISAADASRLFARSTEKFENAVAFRQQ
jgi:hypothetical protein